MADPRMSDTCPCILEMKAHDVPDEGRRDGTANIPVPIKSIQLTKRRPYFSTHNVACSRIRDVLRLGFFVRL